MSGRSKRAFRLVKTGGGFWLGGLHRPGIPMLLCPDGTVCLPVAAHFLHAAKTSRAAPNSLTKEAYTLREWFEFLRKRRIAWDEPSDRLLGEWRDQLVARARNRLTAAGLAEAKVARVFRFYLNVPEALPFDIVGRRQGPFVQKPKARKTRAPITGRHVVRRGATFTVWSGSRAIRSAPAKRPTPNEKQVGKILDALRSRSMSNPTRRRGDRAPDADLAVSERNWLMGRCKSDGGLRDIEVAALSIDSLADALRSEPELPRGPHDLDALAVDEPGQDELLAALERLEDVGRRENLYLRVMGKGGGTRMAAFPIKLVRDLLKDGVWNARSGIAAWWKGRQAGYRTPPNVFLSTKTGLALEPGSIGDIMAAAFKAAKSPGSGHRLRAYYATAMAARIWREESQFSGFVFSVAAENTALDRIAEALGHKGWRTTARHYLDLALKQHFAAQDSAKFQLMRTIMRDVVAREGVLSEGKVRILAAVLTGLASTPADAPLDRGIKALLSDSALNPSA